MGYSISNEDQSFTGTVSGHIRLDKAHPWIRRIDTLAFGDEHRYEGKWYSEAQMLRIIRQKAFL